MLPVTVNCALCEEPFLPPPEVIRTHRASMRMPHGSAPPATRCRLTSADGYVITPIPG
jgi:hypothetical protein